MTLPPLARQRPTRCIHSTRSASCGLSLVIIFVHLAILVCESMSLMAVQELTKRLHLVGVRRQELVPAHAIRAGPDALSAVMTHQVEFNAHMGFLAALTTRAPAFFARRARRLSKGVIALRDGRRDFGAVPLASDALGVGILCFELTTI
jgi:hypothetical protein